MEEEVVGKMKDGTYMNFESFPKDLKGKIWDYLEDKELLRSREVCRSWKKGMEECRKLSLKSRYEEAKTKADKFRNSKRLFKGYKLTRDLLAAKRDFHVGLNCCYGNLFCGTQWATSWLCLYCLLYNERRVLNNSYPCWEYAVGILVHTLLMGFILALLAFGLVVEFLRILFWVLTCFHCGKRATCKCRTTDFFEYNLRNRRAGGPPYPSREELFEGSVFKNPTNLSVPEGEEVSCGVAMMICFYGSDICNYPKHKKCC